VPAHRDSARPDDLHLEDGCIDDGCPEDAVAYLDHAATTPLCPEARRAMLPWLSGRFGNPSGSHSVARAACKAIDEARDVVAAVLGTVPGDVVFTASGTEAANLAVLGASRANPGAVVVSAIEHHCVLRSAQAAARSVGAPLRVVGAGADGVVDLGALGAALGPPVMVVSVQLVNNEVGTLQPWDRRAPGAVLHTDAVQAVAWYDIARLAAGADMVSISAHKFGGPQGAGALAFRRPVEIEPLVHGGPQERERRAGTHNVAAIVGMAAALEAAARDRAGASERVRRLRDKLCRGLLAGIPEAHETAPGQEKAPGHCHLVIEGVDSEALLVLLDRHGLAASAGSACASGAVEPSHVLTAMGWPAERARGALRLTLGHTSTEADVDHALRVVPAAVAHLRAGRAHDLATGLERDVVRNLAAARAHVAPGAVPGRAEAGPCASW
jgi:cysteine desulfurase